MVQIRSAPSGIPYEVQGAMFPVPEDYVTNPDDVTDWTDPINEMFAANDACAFSLNMVYGCAGALLPQDNNILYGFESVVDYTLGSPDHSVFFAEGKTRMKFHDVIVSCHLEGGNDYVNGHAFCIRNSTYVEIDGCTMLDMSGNGVLLYGHTHHVVIDDNLITKLDAVGVSTGVNAATNIDQPAFLQITNNRVIGGTDGESCGLYYGIAFTSGAGDSLVDGNEIISCAQGISASYGGAGQKLLEIISNNVITACPYNGIYNPSGSPLTSKLLVIGNMLSYCGGGDVNIGRASMWLANSQVDCTGNEIISSGRKPDGTPRSFHYASIYCPTTVAEGMSGIISQNVVIDSYYIGISINAVGVLGINNNYVEGTQYSYTAAIGHVDNPASLSITGNISILPAGIAGDHWELEGISAKHLTDVLFQQNRMNGTGFSGTVGVNIGAFVDGGQFKNNYSKNNQYGFQLGQLPAEFLGRGLHIKDNTFDTGTTGIRFALLNVNAWWVFIESNTYINVTNQYQLASGGGGARIKQVMQLNPRKHIISDVPPTNAQVPAQVGDIVTIATAETAGVVMWVCSNAATPVYLGITGA